MKNIRISLKLPLVIATLAAIFVLALGAVLYQSSKAALLKTQYEKLRALNDAKADHIRHYLKGFHSDIIQVAKNPYTQEAIAQLSASWKELETPEATLRSLYIENNPYPEDDRSLLYHPGDETSYSTAHARYHPWFRSFLELKGIYDVFLFDLDGDLIYSVLKENDFATNINNGPIQNTALSDAYEIARKSNIPGEDFFTDFKPYGPSSNLLASFLSVPVLDRAGVKTGVLVFQISMDRFTEIMQIGNDHTGVSYLVNRDGTLRSRPKNIDEAALASAKVPQATIENALKGNPNVTATTDFRGVPVVSASSPVNFLDHTYIVMTEIETAKAFGAIEILKSEVLISAFTAFAAMAFAGAWLARMVTRPLSRISETLSNLSLGMTETQVPERDRQDEIGKIAHAASQFRDTLLRNTEMSEALLQSKLNLEKEVLDRTSSLQEANQELEEFAYRTSHDLRSPLVSSIGLLRTVEEDVQAGEYTDVPECLMLVRQSLEKLDVLVRDILSLTRIKHMEEPEEEVDVAELVEESIAKFGHMDNFDRVTIRRDIQEGLKPALKRSRFQLIVENLISNAVKYQDVTKADPMIHIVARENDDGFEFFVEDNGIGVPEDQRDKMFVMFKRFHPNVSFGSGLGLYMMKKSADILGGELRYDDPGDGSIFTLTIPGAGSAGLAAA